MADTFICDKPARDFRTRSMLRLSVIVTAFALLSACTHHDDAVFFRAPNAPSAANANAGSDAGAIAQALKEAGFHDVSVLASGQVVRVRTTSDALVNCGTLLQYANGFETQTSGSARKAALVGLRTPNDFFVRNVSISSRADIRVDGTQAEKYQISERHKVSVSYTLASSGRSVSRESKIFDESLTGRFSDNTYCRSAGAVRHILK